MRAYSNNELYHFARSKVGSIIASKTKAFLGTGTFVSGRGHVITCSHLDIVSPEDVYVLEPVTQKKYLVEDVVSYPDIDMTILLTEKTHNLEFFKINTNMDLLGKEVFIFGFPEKEYWRGGYGKLAMVISQGELQIEDSLINVYGIEARSIFPGMSGGAVIDVDSRELVGIIHGFDKTLEKSLYSIDQRLMGMTVERNDDLFIPISLLIDAIHPWIEKHLIVNDKSHHFNLVKKIANLIELLGFKVALHDLDNDQQFDILGEIDYGFMSVRLLIICLTASTAFTDIDINKKLKTYRNEYGFDKVCIVTKQGLNDDLARFASVEDIKVLTEDNFLSSMIDFSNYVEYAVNQWEEDGSGINKRYTRLEGRLLQNGEFRYVSDIEDSIFSWMSDPQKPILLILGRYGSGKTTLSRRFTSLIAQNYMDASENARIPILIKLRDTKALTIRELITDLLLNRFKIARSSFGIFTKLNSAGKLLLIFDGFDEMDQSRGFNRTYLNMKELTECFTDKSKAIITCRSEYFLESGEIESLFSSDEFKEIYNEQFFTVLYIDDFSDEQIAAYLDERLGVEEGKRVLGLIENTMGLKELAHRPLLLDMIVETLPRLTNKSNITVGFLYKEYVNQKFDADIRQGRTEISREEKLNIMYRVASFMNSTGRLIIHRDELFELIAELYPRESKRNLDNLTHDIILNSFLTTSVKDRHLEFSHKSFYEFFLAAAFTKDIKRVLADKNSFTSIFGDKKLSYEVFQFMIDFGISKHNLFSLVNKTIGKSFQEVGFLGGNAISGLRFLGANFENRNFDNTVLVEANFSDCSLKNSTLRNCDLSNGNYNNCNLQNVDMTGSNITLANIKSVKTIEMISYLPRRRELLVASTNHDLLVVQLSEDYTEASREYLKGHNDYIFRIGISPDQKKIATGSRDQSIIVWDIENRNILHVLKGHFGNIRGLKFATNEVLLSCGSDGRVIKWYLDDGYHEEVTDSESDFHGIDVQESLDKMVTVDLQSNVKIWDYETLSVINVVNLNAGYIKGVSFWGNSDDYILTTCEDNSLVLLSIKNLSYRKVSNQEGPLKWLATNKQRCLVATGSEDGTVSIWEGIELKEKFNYKAHNEFAATITFNETGKIVFSASAEGSVCIWDISGKNVRKLSEISEQFSSDMFDCNGLILKGTRGLSPFRLKHLKSAGAILD